MEPQPFLKFSYDPRHVSSQQNETQKLFTECNSEIFPVYKTEPRVFRFAEWKPEFLWFMLRNP